MSEQSTRRAHEQADYRGERVHVNGTVLVGRPATIVPMDEPQPEDFTKEAFEGALDKVSRPTSRGKYAHLSPNSEEFARRKQEEIDLEERSR